MKSGPGKNLGMSTVIMVTDALGLHERVLEGGVMELQGRASRAGHKERSLWSLGCGWRPRSEAKRIPGGVTFGHPREESFRKEGEKKIQRLRKGTRGTKF